MGTVADRKLAVVMGASSGTGRELARCCARHGFEVIVCAEDPAIQAVAAQLAGDDGAAARAVQADLRTAAGVETLARAVEETGRPADALILNAGVGVGG